MCCGWRLGMRCSEIHNHTVPRGMVRSRILMNFGLLRMCMPMCRAARKRSDAVGQRVWLQQVILDPAFGERRQWI